MLCAIITAIYLFSFLAQRYLIAIGYKGIISKEYASILSYLLSGFVSICSLLLPAIIFMLIYRIKLTDTIISQRVKPLVAIFCFIVGTTVCLLANFPSNWISLLLENLGFKGISQSSSMVPSVPAYVMSYLTTAIVAPFIEEFVFRGIVLNCFRKYGDSFTIIASSLLFGLLHRNFAQIMFAFICGLALGLSMIKTNCIWIPVGIHMFVNSFYVMLNIIRSHFSLTVYAIVFYMIILVFLLASLIIVLCLLLKKRKEYTPVQKMLSLRSCMTNLFVSPGILIFTGACILFSIANLGVFKT